MVLEISRQIFEKSSNTKFHENPSSGTPVVPCGRTNMTTLRVVFRIFANEPTNIRFVDCIVQFTKASQICSIS